MQTRRSSVGRTEMDWAAEMGSVCVCGMGARGVLMGSGLLDRHGSQCAGF